MFPHTSCRLCHTSSPPLHFSKAGSLADSPNVQICVLGYRLGSALDSVYLFPRKQVKFDRQLKEAKQKEKKSSMETKNEEMGG